MYAMCLKIQVAWSSYYMFENNCNQTDTGGWEVRLMLFNAAVIQLLLYEMLVGWPYLTWYTE